jgi:hypothetical protein
MYGAYATERCRWAAVKYLPAPSVLYTFTYESVGRRGKGGEAHDTMVTKKIDRRLISAQRHTTKLMLRPHPVTDYMPAIISLPFNGGLLVVLECQVAKIWDPDPFTNSDINKAS